MKIKKVSKNNRKKVFEVATYSKGYLFPYAKLEFPPSRANSIARVYVDKELNNEAFTYELESGDEGTVHIDQTNYKKSFDQLLTLLHILDCEVDLVITKKRLQEAV